MSARTGLYKLTIIIVVFGVGLLVSVPVYADDHVDCSTQPYTTQQECEALIAFYNATNGDSWINNAGWNEDENPCTWFGVGCMEGYVSQITLVNNNLSGELPSELGNLPMLKHLVLNQNQLTGTIPSEIGNLTQMQQLSLFNNQLDGELPVTIGNLTSLEELNLSANQLSGAIPSTIGNLSNLTDLYLNQNRLNGILPPELGNLTNLTVLNLSTNQLYGTLPPELGNLSNLESLDLRVNNISGEIPASFGDLDSLRNLYLGFNLLSGSVPSVLGQLSNLIILQLSSNQLSGTIPAELGDLTLLIDLSLDQNNLEGEIPPELGNLTHLLNLKLNTNRLGGEIPSELGNLTQLRTLQLSANRFRGEIPQSFINLSGLRTNSLTLDYNRLSSSNQEVINFVNQFDSNWQDTQTIPPANIQVGETTAERIMLTWEAIPYADNAGYYEVGYSVSSGGPYIFGNHTQTTDKTTTELSVTGLEPETTYYFVVRTVTNANLLNANTLTSDISAEVSATTEQAPIEPTTEPTTPTPTVTEEVTPIPTIEITPEPTIEVTPEPTIEMTPEPTITEAPTETPIVIDPGTVVVEFQESPSAPTFTWVTEVLSEWYQVIITNADSTVVVDTWLAGDVLCTDETCTLTPEALLPFGLDAGTYTVVINQFIDGNVVMLGQASFDVAEANFLDASTGRVAVTLENDPDVSWVQVWVGSAGDLTVVPQNNRQGALAGWYEKATEMTCDANTCRLILEMNPTNGDYVMYIREWNGTLSAWGGPFEITISQPPAQAPTEFIITYEDDVPTLWWYITDGATWYQTWLGLIEEQTGTVTLYSQWHSANDLLCYDDGLCGLTLTDINLQPGQAYTWYTRAWGPGGTDETIGVQGWVEGPMVALP